ncbi:hypothetical protein Nepgr_025868 [Nepenthes gracilis]|uniref:Ubiquitin-conjugating enzyme E2C-binding protein n=1 Tax=Nepenthes gracilis TaxID=150966 RepID=A0AAD3T6S6_NEPGR|nr:hypothetical protein Nepgr_025868 [Nepenthes gracilis]
MATESPRKWRFTWEAQSHIPMLKLFLFNQGINPINQCKDLKIDLQFEKSQLHLQWTEQTRVSLVVPIPKVLVDLESPLNFRALDDHLEAKIVLLLPINHPIVLSFISELSLEDETGAGHAASDYLQPLFLDSGVKSLSNEREVHLYCRNCFFKLTRMPIKSFVDMPSINWREVADNWFGACCCSFGGISEKLVAKYVKSYACLEGTCLLSTTSVILCKDDLSKSEFPDCDPMKKFDKCGLFDINNDGKSICREDNGMVVHYTATTQLQKENNVDKEHKEDEELRAEELPSTPVGKSFTVDASTGGCCPHNMLGPPSKGQEINGMVDLLASQKSFLNGYLGNIFMFRSPDLSKEVEWIEFACPQCSNMLGAYPCVNGFKPFDGGIRLLKCYISSSLSVGSSGDFFRKYTLENMFANQILESAKDELSFRTVVKDLKTKSVMAQIVLLNPNSWCCSGYCEEDVDKQFSKITLHPVIKVLFSDCCDSTESELRSVNAWETKNQADEVYMLRHLMKELIKCLESNNSIFPPSFSSTKGFVLSCMKR